MISAPLPISMRCAHCGGRIGPDIDPDDLRRSVGVCLNCGRSGKEQEDGGGIVVTEQPPPAPRGEDELTIMQAAVILDVADNSVRYHIHKRELLARQGPTGLLVKRSEIEALKAKRESTVAKPAVCASPAAAAEPSPAGIQTTIAAEALFEFEQAARKFLETHGRWVAAVAHEAEVHRARLQAESAMEETRQKLDALLGAVSGAPSSARTATPRRRAQAVAAADAEATSE